MQTRGPYLRMPGERLWLRRDDTAGNALPEAHIDATLNQPAVTTVLLQLMEGEQALLACRKIAQGFRDTSHVRTIDGMQLPVASIHKTQDRYAQMSSHSAIRYQSLHASGLVRQTVARRSICVPGAVRNAGGTSTRRQAED